MAVRPPESDSASAKVTSRQRRIEEQRAKIETMRSAQRKQRAIWIGGVLLVVVVLVVAVMMLVGQQPAGLAQGRQTTSEGANHVDVGSPLSYRNRPPTSGNHYGAGTAGYQFYERAVDPGYWIHNLEHGAIVILYRPDLCAADCVQQLKDVYSSLPRSGKFNVVKAVATPYQDMDHAIAVTAWTWVDEMDAVDPARIRAFYSEHLDRGPESVP